MPKVDFVNHHVHSHFSTLDGLSSPEEIIQRVLDLGQKSISITDHGSMSAIPSMYRAAKQADLGFTPGCEMYFATDRTYKSPDKIGEKYYHQILLAHSNEGYRNLSKMQTTAWEDGYYYKPRIDYQVMEQYHKGITATTSCLGGIVNQYLLRGDVKSAEKELAILVDIFGKENVYVELQNHGIKEQLRILGDQRDLAKRFGLKMLATTDSHFCTCDEADVHDSLLCTGTRAKKTDEKRFRFESDQNFIQSGEQMLKLFPEEDFPGAISNTVELAEKTNFTMNMGENKKYLMPATDCDGKTDVEVLRERVYAGARDMQRYGDENGDIPSEVEERIEYELSVIEKMRFSSYFLIMENIINLLEDNDIHVGPGRGSAPGSVVVYCLGIVNVDPLEHNLLFERFLNPDRISMPDIDVDIPKSKRKKALELVEQEYGKGHVAHLSNYSKMGMRDALLRAAKVYGLSPSDANKFRDEIATWCEDYGESLHDFAKRGVAPKEVKRKIVDTPHYNTIVNTAAKFIGRVMSYGVHASGILITDTPLDDNFPIRKSDKAPLPVCQFDGNDTESIGGVKFDLLGLINLDECEDTERNILLDLGEEVDSSDLAYDDQDVYQMLSHGDGGGVFQLGCVAGDTIVDGQRIDMIYALRNSDLATKKARSVLFGHGTIDYHNINKVVYSGIKDVITISTNTNSLTCTPDHHLWTKRGWVKAGDVTGNDYLLTVPDDFIYKSGVRGLEDIIDLFLMSNSDWERYESRKPIIIDGKTYYPHVVNSNWDRYGYFYPDRTYHSGVQSEQHTANSVNDNGEKIITVSSYGQVVEEYVQKNQRHDHIVSPMKTTWSKIISISDAGKQKTYDLMMDYPINNFIANGIVTHNSSGIQSLLRHMQPSEFKHIPAILALYRPGPMGMGTHDEYCERRLGRNDADVLHEDMEEVVGKNYNLIIYQEDIMHLARSMAGYTGGESDDLRKAMAKKDPAKMEVHKKKFIPEVNKRYGNNLGGKLWDIIEPFSSYAFNLSHSVAYGMVTYRTAWLKAHYPAQFSGAVIDQRMGSADDVFETISWIKRAGVEVYAPDVLRSEMRSVTTHDAIYLPLHIIKGMGAKKAQEIIDERNTHGPFKSIVDLVARCKIPQSLVINMAKAGAFDDSFNANRAAVIAQSGAIVESAKSHKSVMRLQGGIFGQKISTDNHSSDIDITTPVDVITIDGQDVFVDDSTRSTWEREIMGVLLGTHPFEALRDIQYFQNVFRSHPPIDQFTRPVQNARFCGMIHNISNRVSGKGKDYCSFVIETDKAFIPAVRFDKIDESNEGAFVKFEGHINNDANGEEDDFTPQAICHRLIKVNMEKALQED